MLGHVQNNSPILVIHGGAGTLSKRENTSALEQELRDALNKTLQIGYLILERGGSALDAVEQAVRYMEDCPHFNAGRGATLTSEGGIEHDASIMDGRNRMAGAVSASKRIRNPISAARKIMEGTDHIHLTGEGAEAFAREQGLPLMPQWYFFTPERLKSLRKVQEAEQKGFLLSEKDKHGTVGAVARDINGNLAAATSTGGYTNKMPGRVGDSAAIGAGTFADNTTVATSGTGHGESYIRVAMGHRLSCLMELSNLSLSEASAQVLKEITHIGGSGGLIAIDYSGNYVLDFNTPGMYRGVAQKGMSHVGIFSKIDETI